VQHETFKQVSRRKEREGIRRDLTLKNIEKFLHGKIPLAIEGDDESHSPETKRKVRRKREEKM